MRVQYGNHVYKTPPSKKSKWDKLVSIPIFSTTTTIGFFLIKLEDTAQLAETTLSTIDLIEKQNEES